MERLYTPWRLAYIQSQRSEGECLFCVVLAERRDPERLILHRGRHAFVIVNLFPYSNGHLMVVPNRHLANLVDLSTQELHALVESIARCEAILRRVYEPDGLNVGLNLGRAAGAGVVGHLHVHLVPRWSGDTNFATVVGETRIIPETPEQSHERLAPEFQTWARETQQ